MTAGEDLAGRTWAEKRSEPRDNVRDPVRVLLQRGSLIDALIVDRSLKGMRLRLPYGLDVAPSLTAFDLTRFMIHQVDVIWKAYPDIGVRVLSSFDVRAGQGAEAASMRRLWAQSTSQR